MALIVENGSNVPGADSYVSEADAVTIAANLGLSFPVEAEAEVPLRIAALYLEKYRNQYQGTKIYNDQSLQWPREPVYIDNIYQDPTIIPKDLIYAQVVIASASAAGSNLFGTSLGNIVSKSVGDVSLGYANGGSTTNAAYLGQAQLYLGPLFTDAGSGALEFTVSRA